MFALESTLQRKMPKRLLFFRHGTGWIPYEEACPQKRQTVRKRGTSSPALIYRYKVALCRTFQTRCLQRRSKDFGTRWNRSRWWNIHGTPFSSFQRAVHACTVALILLATRLLSEACVYGRAFSLAAGGSHRFPFCFRFLWTIRWLFPRNINKFVLMAFVSRFCAFMPETDASCAFLRVSSVENAKG